MRGLMEFYIPLLYYFTKVASLVGSLVFNEPRTRSNVDDRRLKSDDSYFSFLYLTLYDLKIFIVVHVLF